MYISIISDDTTEESLGMSCLPSLHDISINGNEIRNNNKKSLQKINQLLFIYL